MKYIAKGKQIISPEGYENKVNFLRNSQRWVQKKLAEGVLEGAYSYPEGQGFLIFNVSSHEELMRELIDFPMFCLSDFEVKPLLDFGDYADIEIEEFVKLGVYQHPKNKIISEMEKMETPELAKEV